MSGGSATTPAAGVVAWSAGLSAFAGAAKDVTSANAVTH